jgi:hypothetical protein
MLQIVHRQPTLNRGGENVEPLVDAFNSVRLTAEYAAGRLLPKHFDRQMCGSGEVTGVVEIGDDGFAVFDLHLLEAFFTVSGDARRDIEDPYNRGADGARVGSGSLA